MLLYGFEISNMKKTIDISDAFEEMNNWFKEIFSCDLIGRSK